VRQLLVESVLLSVTGGALALLLAVLGLEVLLTFSPTKVSHLNEIGIDARALAFTLLTSLLTAVAFGLVPALQGSKVALNETLKEGARQATVGLKREKARSLLAATEIALTLVLLIGATLLIESFRRLQAVDPGFDPRQVMTFQISLAGPK